MSSTLRSSKRYDHKNDYYVTPIQSILCFLKEFKKHEPTAFEGKILDPCAGGDANHEMSYPTALKQFGIPSSQIYTIDIRKDSLAEEKDNYLSKPRKGFRTIITNPPFMLAQEIIEKAIDDVDEGGFVIMLLRLNFLGGVKRADFWKKNRAKYCFVHRRRMSFTDDGKTDSIEYAHFVWQKGYNPQFIKTTII